MYEAQLHRYRDLLSGEHAWITQAMSWSVITRDNGGQETAEEVARRLGGRLDQRDLAFEPNEGESVFFLIPVADSVGMLEINGYQASRPQVLRRLSLGGALVHSAYWNIESDNAFSYAANGEVVAVFDAQFPEERGGSNPDAVENFRAPLWASARPEDWQEAMLSLVELRTGIALESSWFERQHLSVLTPEAPEQATPTTAADEPWERLRRSAGLKRDVALAHLAQVLADEFGLDREPGIAARISAQRAGLPLDDALKNVIFRLRDRLDYEGPGPYTTANAEWRRGQAGWALALSLCPVFLPTRQPPHTPAPSYLIDDALTHARNAFGNAWPEILGRITRNL